MRHQFLNILKSQTEPFTNTNAGTSTTITVLLRKEYLEAKVEVLVCKIPFAIVRTSDMPNIQQEDSLAISGTTYIVVEVQQDCEGITD